MADSLLVYLLSINQYVLQKKQQQSFPSASHCPESERFKAQAININNSLSAAIILYEL